MSGHSYSSQNVDYSSALTSKLASSLLVWLVVLTIIGFGTVDQSLAQISRLPHQEEFSASSEIGYPLNRSEYSSVNRNIGRANYEREPDYQPSRDYFREPEFQPTARSEFEQYDQEEHGEWAFQWLPESIIYRAYLAGEKESRLSGKIVYQDDNVDTTSNTMWEATLGTRFGLFRYGTEGSFIPQGFQIDVEASAQVRLDVDNEADVRSTDYRAGVPFTWGYGNHQTKVAYYHVSSHLGDEFVIKNPGFNRLNYSRDVFVLGHGYYITPDLRIYGELGWAFFTDVSEPFEFQFGLDYAPAYPTGPAGAPFFAINARFHEESDYSGALSVQVGWAWRTREDGHLMRAGLHYYNGKSLQYSFFNFQEEQLGFAMWYDF